MTLDDVEIVAQLEPLCFPTPWSPGTYRREISRNRRGSYWVVRPGVQVSGERVPPILAYAGMWLLGDEAHITTIATHPAWRRRRLGEWILLRLLGAAWATEVRLVTLEVREHNAPAQALYKKLGFQQVGIRKGYYHDTGEDALLLTLFYLDNEAVWRFLQQVRAAIEEEGVTR